MAKIKVKDLPKDKKLSEEELKAVKGGTGTLVQPVGASVKGVGILMCSKGSSTS